MSTSNKRLIPAEEVEYHYKQLLQTADSCIYELAKHRLVFESERAGTSYLRLPIHYNWNEAESSIVTTEDKAYLISIIESGNAALAYCEDDQIIEHKVFKAYMVRKKQGKSQIKHLKTKGKSKAGSRVRLANTEHFFEEIHERITEWLEYFEIEQIALSCSKTLYPFLFSDDFELDRKDERLIKIPKHIPEANFENLLSIHEYLMKGELIVVD